VPENNAQSTSTNNAKNIEIYLNWLGDGPPVGICTCNSKFEKEVENRIKGERKRRV
jgi:hypothetical protein